MGSLLRMQEQTARHIDSPIRLQSVTPCVTTRALNEYECMQHLSLRSTSSGILDRANSRSQRYASKSHEIERAGNTSEPTVFIRDVQGLSLAGQSGLEHMAEGYASPATTPKPDQNQSWTTVFQPQKLAPHDFSNRI